VILSLQNNQSVTFDTIFNFISYGVLMNYQTNTVFVFTCVLFTIFIWVCMLCCLCSCTVALDSSCK